MDFSDAHLALRRDQTAVPDRGETTFGRGLTPPRPAAAPEAPRLTLGRGIAGLEEAQTHLACFLRRAGCDARTLFRAELVLKETLLNIRQHAELPHRPARAWLDTWLTEHHAVIAVEDDGPPFDPVCFAAPRANNLAQAASVGGLRLIRRNADALRYARTHTGHNRLELQIALAG